MKYCYILFFISVSYFLSAQENVGIGTLTPHSSSILELKSFDKGILIPRMKTNARLAIVDPDPGLCVYDATTQSFWYYDQFWREVNETDAFINDNGLVRNNGNIATDDFLFGSFDLPTGTAHDTMMFFDRSKAALRAGDVQSTAWIADSIGHASIALGYNPRASGDYSVSLGDRTEATALASTAIGTLSEATGMFATAIGNFTQASGPASVALGDQTDADGLGSTALGRLTLASGDYATAAGNLSIASGTSSVAMGSQAQATRTAAISIGLQTQATGSYSTAFGRTTKAESNNTFALGRFNVGGGHQSLWYDNDPLFEIGNGSDTSNLHNAFTILKNGKTGIGTASPDTNFTVVGVSRAAMDTSETDYIEMSHGGNNAYINVVGTGNLDIRYQDANIMTLANDQNVGIGTNSPDTKLSVIGKVRGAIGVSEQEYTEIGHGGDNGFINTHGDGELHFRHDNNTMMSLTDAGDLNITGSIQLGLNSGAPAAGEIRYNDTLSVFEGHDGSQWESLGVFSRSGNVVRAMPPYNDFVFGNDTISDISPVTASLFFLHESKGAFRAGKLTSSKNWNQDSLGLYSFAAGHEALAKGKASFAFGTGGTVLTPNMAISTNPPEASGDYSVAIGPSTVASSQHAIAMGLGAAATNHHAVAIGDFVTASGENAVAIGRSLDANSYLCTAIGINNVGGASPLSWVSTDPVFEIGIGITGTPHNAMTVLKNGNVGLNRSNPGYPLHIGTNTSNGNGAYLSIGGTWTNGSSRKFKDRFREVDNKEILKSVATLDIRRWHYQDSDEGEHLGPIAEEFYDAFGLGRNPQYISTVDADGVALAAIQALYDENQALQKEVANLHEYIGEIMARLEALDQTKK